mmetsp:Transcript_5054/g.14111  ORF Transcript_5054/g.14111 Transcript_5054/m.14111 type:complete len:127 (+) Transcript_5054:248-628(+)
MVSTSCGSCLLVQVALVVVQVAVAQKMEVAVEVMVVMAVDGRKDMERTEAPLADLMITTVVAMVLGPSSMGLLEDSQLEVVSPTRFHPGPLSQEIVLQVLGFQGWPERRGRCLGAIWAEPVPPMRV